MSNLLETLVNDGRFDTFVSAIQASNLSDTLDGTGPFTVFAPTDDAFIGLPEGMVDRIMNDIANLTSVVTYHIVPGAYGSHDLDTHEAVTTVQGSALKIQRMDGRDFVNDALITRDDIRADNGVIHAIDAVLLPPTQ